MKQASRELLASREDVWRFLAEPYHLPDWWPGILRVEPDRRGFAEGARWRVSAVADPPRLGLLRLPWVGRPSGPISEQTLVIMAVEPYERWSWQLIRPLPLRRERIARVRSVEVQLRFIERDRTNVAVQVGGGLPFDLRLAQTAVNRLYDLVQTAATF
jgi:uncharacterized protein YndB with AHSA1/START domain